MRTKLVLVTAMTAASFLAIASRDGVAAPGSSGGRLVLTSFLQRDRTDVRRNEILEFRFSAPLRRSSVDLRTLQVVELIPEGRRPVVGARIVDGNVVRLDPRRSQRNYDASLEPNSTVTERDHEIGFSASAQFEVFIRSGAGKTVVRARDGRRIARQYLGNFATNTLYDDPYPGQPSCGGVTVKGLGDIDPSIEFSFSEPILPESMRLGDTVRVTRGDGTAVLGTLVPSGPFPNLNHYSFTPTGGFDTGVDIYVAVTTGATDLVGNPLRRPYSAYVLHLPPAK